MRNCLRLIVLLTAAVMSALVLTACGTLDLPNTVWVPLRATNTSGDEVTTEEVYGTVYSNYQGSLTFSDNKTFELWLSPGDPSDGTHTGVYEWKDGAVNALFNDGTEEQFTVKNDGESPLLVVPYGGYEVYFIKQ